MPVHIPMTAEELGRSRFAISPAQEVIDTLRRRDRHPLPHARKWYHRAARQMRADDLELLQALVPDDHDYCPDFLTPAPSGRLATIEEQTETIAATPGEVVEHHLDVGLRGRRARPDVVEFHGGTEEAYERWRRPMPPALADVVDDGPAAVAEGSARAVRAFFDVGIGPDWPEARAVLERDIQRRSDLIAERGSLAVLDGLDDDTTWSAGGLVLDRPYTGVIDWARDGLLLVPSTAHCGRAAYAAERPLTPMISYRADGTAALNSARRPSSPQAIADLLGETRATLLALLDEPTATADLSRRTGWAQPTVSYHLKILLRADLVCPRRSGHKVLYRRTSLGQSLIGR